jgi:hypothetical protein
MKIENKNKHLIVAFLILAFVSPLIALPIANSHTPPWTIQTMAYVAIAPSRIGIGQTTTIVVWVDYFSSVAGGGQGQRWDGFKIDITKPDGTKETIGPWKCRSDVASDWSPYTPTQLGTYTIVFSWPGQTETPTVGLPSTNAFIGDYYAGDTSDPAYLIVQKDPIIDWVEPSLPTTYWQVPINAANRGWSSLASNWLKGSWLVNNFQSWGVAPESAHVLWTKPLTPGLAGGINDAAWPGIPSDVNDYESPWTAPIIMNGKIYHNAPPVSDVATYGYYCRDLYTGEILWYKNGTDNGLNNPFTTATSYTLSQSYLGLTQGQLYHYYSVNGAGILAYLIIASGTTWYYFDASTGNLMLTLTNVPSGTAVTDQDGSLLRYSYTGTTGNLLCWNSSQSIPPLGPLGTNQQQWKMRFGSVINAVNDTSWTKVGSTSTTPAEAILPRSGYTMNITVQKNLPGSIKSVIQDGNRVPKMIFGTYGDNPMAQAYGPAYNAFTSADTFSAWVLRIDEHVTSYSPQPNFTYTQNNNLGFGATLLWNKNITVPVAGKRLVYDVSGGDFNSKIFVLSCDQLRQKWGYSLETGEMLWGPTPAEGQMNFYGTSNNIYYDKILSVGYAGTLNAYEAKTGKLLWTYNASTVGRESPYGDNYPLSISAVADGKVYLHSTEHSPTKPLWRGSYLRCINITDGTEIWKLLDYNMGLGIADGYIVSASQYDNLIYCIGKGPSAVTVSTPQTLIPKGTGVLITGTVTDQSPGAPGTPAIADSFQQGWMEYLYEQQAMPKDAKGVKVHLTATDPNGNFQEIGYATSDTGGTYGITWIPPVEGTYQVTATFDGSKSYGSSYTTTHFAVGSAAAATIVTQAPTKTTAPTATVAPIITPAATNAQNPTSAGPEATTYVAIGSAVIVIVAAAAALILRRRRK